MQLGRHLRELWRLRLGVAISFALALFIAVSSIDHVGLLPPKVSSRQLEIAAASTRVLVDSPRSEIIDLRTDTYAFTSLTTRAALLGNVMASAPVREYIARRAKIDPQRIQASAPSTADVPRNLSEPGSEKRASDILRSTDQYRIDIQSNPTVPILNISAQAPNKDAAERLADGAVDGLRDYLAALAVRQGTDPKKQVRLAFIFVFTLSCSALLFLSRVHRGWRAAAADEAGERSAAPRPDRAVFAPANGRDVA